MGCTSEGGNNEKEVKREQEVSDGTESGAALSSGSASIHTEEVRALMAQYSSGSNSSGDALPSYQSESL